MNRAADVVRERGGRGRRRGGRASGEQTSHMPQSSASVSPKCSATCRCRQALRLGEADEPVGARQRLLLVAREQRVDPRGGVGRRLGHLDLHRAAGVEAAPDEPDLLEHADEHARVGLAAPQLLGRDLAAAAEPRVRRAQVVDGRDVGAREPAQLLGVGTAREQERVGRAAVAAGPADHLDVALERLRVVVERDEADVGLVDPHPERGRRDDGLDAALDERLLRRRALVRLEPGVVVDGGEIVHAQRARERLAAAAGAGVDDRRGAAELVQAADERPQPRLLAVDDLDVVAQVRPDDAGANDLGLAAERRRDLPLGGGRRRRGHAEDRRAARARRARAG